MIAYNNNQSEKIKFDFSEAPMMYIIEDNRVRHMAMFDSTHYLDYNGCKETTRSYVRSEDAHYNNILNQISRGSRIEAFKTIDDYEYYYERLKNENPEYLV